MSALDALDDLVSNLSGTGYTVLPYVDENPYPPCLMIAGADPFIESSDLLNTNERFVRFSIVCMVKTGNNKFMSRDIVTMIEKVLVNLGDWEVEVVPAPSQLQSNEGYYLGCIIQVKHEFDLE